MSLTQNKKDTKVIHLRLFNAALNRFCEGINLLGLTQFQQVFHSIIYFIPCIVYIKCFPVF